MNIQKLFIISLVLFFLNFISAQDASLSPNDFSVVVDTKAPEITILSPLNTTYTSTSVLVNYSITDPTLDKIWYSLNNQQNITISNPFSLNLAQGFQHLVIYANDSFSRTNSSEVYFTTEQSSMPYCGDNSCDANEDCNGCAHDCGDCPAEEENTTANTEEQIQEIPLAADFSIDKKELKISLSPGEKANQTIIIKNTGERVIKITIFIPPVLEKFITLSKDSFFIKLEEEEKIQVNFNIPETAEFNVHIGNILIRGLGIEKALPTTLEIESKDSLFDVILTIPPELKVIAPGKNIIANLKITDIGNAGLVNVTIKTVIKDFEGNIIAEKQEIISINQILEFNQTLEIPSNTKAGKYILYSIVTYDEKSATSSQEFEITGRSSWEMFALIGLIVLAILIMIIGYLMIKFKKDKTKKKSLSWIFKPKAKRTKNS